MRRGILLAPAALLIAAALFLAPGPGAQSAGVPPDATYLATWLVSVAPNDVATNPDDGTLAVVEAGKGTIEILRPGGRHDTFRNGFRDPRCAAYLPGGTLLVGEATSGTVKGYAPDGRVVLTLGSPNGEFMTPNDVAVAPALGRIFVVDSADNAVKAYRQTDGTFEFRFGSFGTGPGEFRWPISVAVNTRLNEVYVGDSRNRRIGVFDAADGSFKRSIGSAGKGDGNISFVGGLHVDSADRLFVVESLGSFVQIFTPDGTFLGKIGEHGDAGGQLRTPKAVGIDRFNRLVVASFLDRRVEVWGLDTYENPPDIDLAATGTAVPPRIKAHSASFRIDLQVDGASPAEIDQGSVRLNGSVTPLGTPFREGPRLSLRFTTAEALATLPPGALGRVLFVVTGRTLDGRVFQADVPATIVSHPGSTAPARRGRS